MNPIKTVLKTVFTPSVVFLGILLVFLSVFLFSNINTLFTSMGYETKTALKTALVVSEGNLKTLIEVNEKNVKALEVERATVLQVREQIREVTEAKEKSREVVARVALKKAKRITPVIAKITESAVYTPTTVTLPKAELDQLSAANIDQIHEVFDALFPQA
jgi:hypothetical protein